MSIRVHARDNKMRKSTYELHEEIYQLKTADMRLTPGDLAKQFNISKQAVHYIFKKFGLEGSFCRYCGKKLYGKHMANKYCNDECRLSHTVSMHICGNCGAEFEKSASILAQSETKSGKRFCCRDCFHEFMGWNKKGRKHLDKNTSGAENAVWYTCGHCKYSYPESVIDGFSDETDIKFCMKCGGKICFEREYFEEEINIASVR